MVEASATASAELFDNRHLVSLRGRLWRSLPC